MASRESKIENKKRIEARISVEKVVSANPEFSIRRLSTLTQLSYLLTRNILLVDLKLKSYKYQKCQKLLGADCQKRVNFATWLLNLPPKVSQYIIGTDESYFYLVESVNKQDNRIWLKERPKDWIERLLQDEKILVWCKISENKIYRPYFFETSVNQHSYLKMLKFFFWNKYLHTTSYKKYYFKQDGSASHAADLVRNWLNSKFCKRFITKNQ